MLGDASLPAGAQVVRFQRLAEQVSDDLRSRILIGDLAVAGAEFPKEDDLRMQYPVSKPTLREAMRIIEAEGLVTVRRGAIGGARIHRPTSEHVAYSLGLVLASQRVDIQDVGDALKAVEPACAALCAQREDRASTVVPVLREIHDNAIQVAEDLVQSTALSRRFHEAIVEGCGNQSLIALAGALESLWTSCEASWASAPENAAEVPVEVRMGAWDEHLKILTLIENGDVEGTSRAVAEHLVTAQPYPVPADLTMTVSPAWVRSMFIETTQR